MSEQTKAAECGDTQTASENVLTGQQQNTTRRANPVSFVLPIDDRFRLTADGLCWHIERRKGEYWRPIEWHNTIDTAVNSLGRRLVRTSEVKRLADALTAIDRVTCALIET